MALYLSHPGSRLLDPHPHSFHLFPETNVFLISVLIPEFCHSFPFGSMYQVRAESEEHIMFLKRGNVLQLENIYKHGCLYVSK